LSFFYGTRVNYRCFSIQEGENEHSEFVMKSPQKAVQFPTPVDWTEWQDDEHGVYVAKMPDAEAMKALEQFANYYLQHDYSTVTNMMEYCWELSVDAHIGAMVLNVAVAIECIAESLVIRKEAEVQEAYEELIRVVLEDIAPGWIKAGDNKLATLERQRAVNRFSGVVARRKELGGKKLVEQAFKDVGAPCANSEMDLWQKARNSTAHGNSKERKSAQEMLDRFYKVVDLLYRLVLSQMNYTGRRYDYYTKGWPVAEFLPPSRNQDTSE